MSTKNSNPIFEGGSANIEESAGSFGVTSSLQKQDEDKIRKLGGHLLQRAIIPTPGHLKYGLILSDIILKFELIIMELVSIMFWSSAFELFLWTFGVMFFIQNHSEMNGIWWFAPHIFRCTCGFYLFKKTPNTHDIINNANFPEQQKMGASQIFQTLREACQDAVDHFTEFYKKVLCIYFFLTFVCSAIDLISFLAYLQNLESGKSAYADTSLIIISLAFYINDAYYILWVLSLKGRVPGFMGDMLQRAAFGAMDGFTNFIVESIQRRKQKQDQRIERELNNIQNFDPEQNVARRMDIQ